MAQAAAQSAGHDYVIVGAGSAGAVLAARLSEDPSVRVLLLEAGPEAEADEISIPAAFSALFKTRWDWNYTTTEQKQLHSRRAYWPRMKALGGCSSMNAMIYIRGNRADYDTWRDEYGATGWGYDDVLPYFIRAEGNTRLGAPYHGQDGPLHVEDRRYTHELTSLWVESAVSAGMKPTDDFNGAEQEGAGLYQVTCKKGHRWSVNDAYLAPGPQAPEPRRRDRRVRDPDRGRGRTGRSGSPTAAHGREITVRRDARGAALRRSREQPAPADALRHRAGQPPARARHRRGRRHARAWASNLQDHPAIPMLWYTRGTSDLADFNNVRNLLRWKTRGTGPLTSNVGEGGGFLRTSDDLAAPDMQYHVAPAGFYDNGMHEPTQRMFTAAPTLVVRPQSRLTPAPLRRPGVAPGDRRGVLRRRGRPRRDGGRHEAALGHLQPGPARASPRPTLAAARPTRRDDDFVEHVRTWTQTLYHPVATCSMGTGRGRRGRPGAAASTASTGLRVVDASVMPVVPRGNTNAPTVMVAEKAADLIRSSR